MKPKSVFGDLKIFLKLFTFYFLLFHFIGCEAFVRKFTRKPKKDKLPKEQLVLLPEEYKGQELSKEDAFRQYFLFWKSWQDELLESLSASGVNHKKQVSCVEQSIKNLQQLKTVLNSQNQNKLEAYITRLKDLRESIIKDVYGSRVVMSRQTAERIKRGVLKDFSYSKAKEYL